MILCFFTKRGSLVEHHVGCEPTQSWTWGFSSGIAYLLSSIGIAWDIASPIVKVSGYWWRSSIELVWNKVFWNRHGLIGFNISRLLRVLCAFRSWYLGLRIWKRGQPDSDLISLFALTYSAINEFFLWFLFQLAKPLIVILLILLFFLSPFPF